MKSLDSFKNLIDLITTYNTEEKCSRYIALKRWGGKPVCPHCSYDEKVYTFSDGIYFKCGSCRKKFTVRVGTIFGDSKIPLSKWFACMYLFTSNSKGISSVQLAKQISVTQKSAWFMLHRLRYGMENEEYKKPLENTVETDETVIGGKEKNKHLSKRAKDGLGGYHGFSDPDKKTIFGIVERGGNVVAKLVEDRKRETLQPIIIKNVKEFARVITDEYYAYGGLNEMSYTHDTIKHALKQYVVGDIHTNTIENFWSTLKRGIYGIYHQTSRKHMQRYLEEFAYRYNHRAMSDNFKFDQLLLQSNVGWLEYRTLIGKKDVDPTFSYEGF
jgi:transposase-like protein